MNLTHRPSPCAPLAVVLSGSLLRHDEQDREGRAAYAGLRALPSILLASLALTVPLSMPSHINIDGIAHQNNTSFILVAVS